MPYGSMTFLDTFLTLLCNYTCNKVDSITHIQMEFGALRHHCFNSLIIFTAAIPTHVPLETNSIHFQ